MDAVTIWITMPTDSTGHVNFTGYVNRHGSVVSGCTTQGIDCIPLVIKNALPRAYGVSLPNRVIRYNGDVPGPNRQLGYYVQLPS